MWAAVVSMSLVGPSDVRAAEPPVGEASSATAGPPVASPATAVVVVDPFRQTPVEKTPRSQTERGKREAAWTMFGVGSGVLTVTYLGTAFAGAALWDGARASQRYGGQSSTTRRELAYGASLMIPVAGPFIGMGFSGTAMRSLGLGVSGVLQVSGLVVAYFGARNLLRLRRAKRVRLSGGVTPTSTQAGLTVRF